MHLRNTGTDKERSYAGVSSPERREARRERIIEAAIRLYGQMGRSATVKRICAEAGLTERYFYESFPNNEALTIAAFQVLTGRQLAKLDAIARAHAEATPEERGRAVLEAFYLDFKNDPVSARLFIVELAHLGLAVEEHVAILRRELGAFLAGVFAPGTINLDPDAAELTQAGAVGAVLQILKTWIQTDNRASLDAVVSEALKHCRLLTR